MTLKEGLYAPLIVTMPYKIIGIDIVGPLPSSCHWYILVVVDYATCYPEVVPLRNIRAVMDSLGVSYIVLPSGVPQTRHHRQRGQFHK